jgi:hypothetical protein
MLFSQDWVALSLLTVTDSALVPRSVKCVNDREDSSGKPAVRSPGPHHDHLASILDILDDQRRRR